MGQSEKYYHRAVGGGRLWRNYVDVSLDFADPDEYTPLRRAALILSSAAEPGHAVRRLVGGVTVAMKLCFSDRMSSRQTPLIEWLVPFKKGSLRNTVRLLILARLGLQDKHQRWSLAMATAS
jgi:hypothetical protein